MRFPQLNIGDQFEYQGESWTKTGPLTAVRVSDNQSAMIPRYAAVTRLEVGEEMGVPDTAEVENIPLAELEHLLDVMAKRIVELLDSVADLSDDTRQAMKAKLAGIRRDVRAMVGGGKTG